MRTESRWKRLFVTGWLVSGLVAIAAFRQWGGRIKEAEERAAQIERTQEANARSRAAEERLRIARELHDSLTHNISVIKMQSGVAVHLARKRREEIPAALLAIEEAAAEASRELRETLQVLRRAEPAVGTGLADLPRLISRCASLGLRASLHTVGAARELPSEVDAAAYRIVQEALTNVSRHARGAAAVVTVEHQSACLHLRIDDDGPGNATGSEPAGLGLIGMRERAAALGGSLVAYTRPDDGGFTVHATLPLAAP